MRKIVLMMVVLMMVVLLSATSMTAVEIPDKTSDAAKEKEKVITGDKALEPVIIGFKGKIDRKDRERLVKDKGGKISHSYTIINAVAAHIPPEAMDGLRRNPHVNYIEDDYTVTATEQQLPWGVDHIDAPIVHECNKGTGIKVAILDTGIDRDHPDMSANYKGGIDYVNDDSDPMDDNGHGTHCAGIVASVGNEIGVIGVAPEASLYGVKVLDNKGSGYYRDIIAGIEWSVDHDMHVTSMSLGGNSHSQALQDACDAAYANGVLLVAAAGNDGWSSDSVDYPARYTSVIAVAATDSNDNRPYWSSQGSAVELAAPGVSIYSTCWDDTYSTKQGTSMACPHVSGTAALVMASDPELSNVEVRERLQTTADDLGDSGRDNLYGYGLVNADEAAPPTGNIPPVADAGSDQTAVVGETVEFNGSGSSDQDGTIVSYDWDFGDGTPTGTGVTTTHAYSSPDTYTVNLTVTDDGGATDTDAITVTVTEGSSTNTMHVDSIDMELNFMWGRFYYATARVTIVDATGSPVVGANVSCHWEGATNDQDYGVTGHTGQTPPLRSDIRLQRSTPSGTTFTFVVDGVTKDEWTYNPDANEETEDDVTVP